MTLERLTERLQEEQDKIGKVDGRRFNSRSRTKMMWEMRKIDKANAALQRKKRNGVNRSMFTPEELQEYKNIEDRFREEQASARTPEKELKIPAFTSTSAGTPAGTPEKTTPERRTTPGESPVSSTSAEPATRRKSVA